MNPLRIFQAGGPGERRTLNALRIESEHPIVDSLYIDWPARVARTNGRSEGKGT